MSSASASAIVPATWEQLDPSWPFCREPTVQAAYDIRRAKLKSEGKPIEQNLLEQYPQLKTYIVVTENEFPYYLTSDISHLIAWLPVQIDPLANVAEYLYPLLFNALNPSSSSYSSSSSSPASSQNELNQVEFKMFENFPANRSIKGIRHFHIFIRRKPFQYSI